MDVCVVPEDEVVVVDGLVKALAKLREGTNDIDLKNE